MYPFQHSDTHANMATVNASYTFSEHHYTPYINLSRHHDGFRHRFLAQYAQSVSDMFRETDHNIP